MNLQNLFSPHRTCITILVYTLSSVCRTISSCPQQRDIITHQNFNTLLPALASVVDSPRVEKAAPRKEFDPLLTAASDSVLKMKPLSRITSRNLVRIWQNTLTDIQKYFLCRCKCFMFTSSYLSICYV